MKTLMIFVTVISFGLASAAVHAQVCPPVMSGGNAPVSSGITLPSGLANLNSASNSSTPSPTISSGGIRRGGSGFSNSMGAYSFSQSGPTAGQLMQGAMMQQAAAVARNQQIFSKTTMSAARRSAIANTHAQRALASARAAESAGRTTTAVRYYQRAVKAGANDAQAAIDRLRRRGSAYPNR